jgi:hypothetical protein
MRLRLVARSGRRKGRRQSCLANNRPLCSDSLSYSLLRRLRVYLLVLQSKSLADVSPATVRQRIDLLTPRRSTRTPSSSCTCPRPVPTSTEGHLKEAVTHRLIQSDVLLAQLALVLRAIHLVHVGRRDGILRLLGIGFRQVELRVELVEQLDQVLGAPRLRDASKKATERTKSARRQ